MFLRCCFALVTLTLCSAVAQADTFELNSTFFSLLSGNFVYATVTGPITIDTTIGTVTATDLTLTVYNGTPATPPLGSEELGGAGFTIYQGGQTYASFPQEIDPPTYYYLVIADSGYENYLELEFPVASLVGYGGGALCTAGACLAPGFSGDDINSTLWSYNFDGLNNFDGFPPEDAVPYLLQEGTLTPEATAVPEPSTFTLIGTGVIGLAGAFRRQRLARLARKLTTP
jgi:PEP-CTERM motif